MARFVVHARHQMTNARDSVRMRAVPSFLRLVAAGVLGIALAACQNERDAAPSEATEQPPLRVTVQRATLQRVPFSLEAVGQAEGSREVEIRPRVTGILEKRLYAEGEPVKAGQTLFLIDRAPYEIAVEKARAELAQERVRLELAQKEAARLESLAKSRAISQREYDEAVSTARQSAAAIEAAKARLAEAELNLSYTQVKAPIGGITSRAVRSEGSLVNAHTDLLTNITQVDPIWIRFSLAEADFERVRGHEKRAQVQLLDREGKVVAQNGRLNFAASTVDPKLGTVQMRAEFPNPGLRWLPGQFVRVQILAGEQEAFLVPQSAVFQTEQSRMVWIVGPDGKAAQQPIETANWIGTDWIVTSGLKPGDAVIVDNLMRLRPGMPVEPQQAEAAEAQPAATAQASPAVSSPSR